jgi:hypothetical protein
MTHQEPDYDQYAGYAKRPRYKIFHFVRTPVLKQAFASPTSCFKQNESHPLFRGFLRDFGSGLTGLAESYGYGLLSVFDLISAARFQRALLEFVHDFVDFGLTF